jgi:hypothetical protein
VGAGPNILEATWLALADGFEYAVTELNLPSLVKIS